MLFKKTIFSFNKLSKNQFINPFTSNNKNLLKVYFSQIKYFTRIVPVILTDIGEGTKEVHIRKWLVKEGDSINEYDDIAEVESDKATAPIPAPASGIVSKLNYKIGEKCLVGKSLCEITSKDGEKDNDGDITINEPPVNLDKKDNFFNEKCKFLVLNTIYYIDLASPSARHLIKSNNLDWTKIASTGKNGVITRDDALKYMGKIKEDSTFKTERMMTMEQPKSFTANEKVNKISQTVQTEKIKHTDSDIKSSHEIKSNTSIITSTNEDKLITITGFKKAMTKTMTQSNSIPSFLYSDEYNVDRLVSLRNEVNTKYSKEAKLSFMPFIIKAVSLTLNEYPDLNSIVNPSLDNEGFIYEYTVKKDHNISVAIDGPDGLVVPNIKQVQYKSVRELHHELVSLRDKANNKKLAISDYSNGTFSISNIGNIGGKQLGPVILPPQVCIIGISRMIDTVKIVHKNDIDELNSSEVHYFEGGKEKGVVFHKSINFCISADHRVIDGAYVARFSQKLRSLIENPIKILLG